MEGKGKENGFITYVFLLASKFLCLVFVLPKERKQREVFYEWKESEENWFYKGVLLLAKGVNPISTKLLPTPLTILIN